MKISRKKLAAAAIAMALLAALVIAAVLSPMIDNYATAYAEKQYGLRAGDIQSLCVELLRDGDGIRARDTLRGRLGDYIIEIDILDASGDEFATAADRALLNRAGNTAEADSFPLPEGGTAVITRFSSFEASDDVLMFDGSLWLGMVVACTAAILALAALAALFAPVISKWLVKEEKNQAQ